MAEKTNIKRGYLAIENLKRGDMIDYSFEIHEIDLSGKDLIMHVKTQPRVDPVLKFSTKDDSILLEQGQNGEWIVTLSKPASETRDVNPGKYLFDIKMYENDDDKTIVDGHMTFVASKTERE